MFAEIKHDYGNGYVKADITTDNAPIEFPVTGADTDNLTGMLANVRFAPGSTIFAANGTRIWVLDSNYEWVEQ